MQNSHNLEESLRETACLGDVGKVGVLVRAGVDINSQNTVNGWTALHWAAKRNHKDVVSFLLQSGANPTIRSHKNDLAVDVAQSEEVKLLLSGVESKSANVIGGIAGQSSEPDCLDAANHSNLENRAAREDSLGTGFVPNYLMNPEFPYSESATEFATRLGIQNRVQIVLKQNETNYSAVGVDKNKSQFVDNMQTATLGELPCSTTSADESVLVLKCRLADSEETDFIEVELDRKCLNFEALVETCTTELNVDRMRLKKIRKLPNTVVRNDRDVKRLVQFQEIEIVID